MQDRREFLTLSGVTALYLFTGCGGSNNSSNSNGGSGGGTPTNGTLPIPELRQGTAIGGVMHYDINIVEAQHTFFEGVQTKTWAFDGTYLGPTLLLNRGANVSINYTNQLPVPTTVHGHGMHVPGAMDGTAHQPIAVGSTWSAQYLVDQNACTNWYHPHYIHQTAPQVYQGLAGLIIIEDDESRSLDLPRRYGIDDIPLVLQDRFFSADKTQIVYSPSNQQIDMGYIGDTFITNGAISPTFEAEAKQVRFRILNGSNSTIYELGFSNGQSFQQIASDNALLERPVSMNRIILSPAERAEIVVDFTNAMGATLSLQEYRYGQTFLTVNVSKDATQVTQIPAALATLEPIPTPTRSRQFVLAMGGMGGNQGMNGNQGGTGNYNDGMNGNQGNNTDGMGGMVFTINGKSMDMNRIDVALSRGDIEEWEIINSTGMNHNFHIHDTHFRVVSRNDDPSQVAENDRGYKDTVYMPPFTRAKIIVAIPNDGVTADNNNPYMFHCHFLEHEDNGMMGQFTVS